MVESSQHIKHLFVVRIWNEIDHATSLSHWRGTVSYQSTQECRSFSRIEDLMVYIAEHSGLDRQQGAPLPSVPSR